MTESPNKLHIENCISFKAECPDSMHNLYNSNMHNNHSNSYPTPIQYYLCYFQIASPCAHCKAYHKLSYKYSCRNCQFEYCLPHYTQHCDATVHYIIENVLTLLDTDTLAKKSIVLSSSVNDLSASISSGKKIFVMGGGIPAIDDVLEANIKKKQLIPKAPMQSCKFYHSLCIYKGFIYSIGGSTILNNSLSDCEKYDIQRDESQLLPYLICSRRCCSSFVYNNFLYSFAGCHHLAWYKTFLNSIERLSLDGGEWEEALIKNAPTRRVSSIAMRMEDEIIIAGGYIYDAGMMRMA